MTSECTTIIAKILITVNDSYLYAGPEGFTISRLVEILLYAFISPVFKGHYKDRFKAGKASA